MAEKDEGGGKAEVNFSCGLFLLLRCSLKQKAWGYFCIWKVISNKSSQPSQWAFKAFVVYVDKLPEHIKNV